MQSYSHLTKEERTCLVCEFRRDTPIAEFALFREIEDEINAPIYFADTHSPWQRGSNENLNGLLRWYFPKGYDFRYLTEEKLRKVVKNINDRPRKCLGWKSPAEVYEKCRT